MRVTIHLLKSAVLALLLPAALQVPAQSADPIVLGASVPIGPSDDGTGRRVIAGTRAYIEAVNARGGVSGRPLLLVTKDNGNDPARDAQNIRALVSEKKAVAIVSCIGEASCAASAVAAADLRVPLIGPMAPLKTLSQASNPMVFRVRVPFEREATSIARQLRALAAFRVAILTENDKDSEVVTALREALTKEAATAAVLTVSRARKDSFEAVLKNLGSGQYQALILDIGRESMEMLASSGLEHREEWPLILITTASAGIQSLLGSFKGKILGFTAVVPDPEASSIAFVKDFQADVAKYAEPSAVTYAGLEAYVNVKILVEALRRAGPNFQSERLTAALNGMPSLDLVGMPLSFRPGRASASDFVECVVRSRFGTILK
jgi:ABC-type branched-subunit amino acid transport system substrate-binding protein